MNKSSLYIVLLIVAVLAYLYFSENPATDNQDNKDVIENRDNPADPRKDLPPPGPTADLAKTGYKGKKFVYTRHADCRMDCREIDAYEVSEILTKGKINQRKSDPSDRPCPTYAYEGFSRDNQRIRAVIAECDNIVKLVTVIDLDNEYRCNCN